MRRTRGSSTSSASEALPGFEEIAPPRPFVPEREPGAEEPRLVLFAKPCPTCSALGPAPAHYHGPRCGCGAAIGGKGPRSDDGRKGGRW